MGELPPNRQRKLGCFAGGRVVWPEKRLSVTIAIAFEGFATFKPAAHDVNIVPPCPQAPSKLMHAHCSTTTDFRVGGVVVNDV
jgi:hypothetical protein